MRTLRGNTVVVETETITDRNVLCDLPDGLIVVHEEDDAFLAEAEQQDRGTRVLREGGMLRADQALKEGLIFVSNGNSGCSTVVARLRTSTLDCVIRDVPEQYLIGIDAGQLYLIEKDSTELQPQKWPVVGLLTVPAALANGIIRART